MRALITFFTCLFLVSACANAPKPKVSSGPHVFYPGVVLYLNKRPIGIVVSKDRFLTCLDALGDTKSALARIAEEGDGSHSAVGICIPVPVYDASDLVPNALY